LLDLFNNKKFVFKFFLINQTSEKARFIAKNSIVDRKPCGPMGNCNNSIDVLSERAMGFYPDKVFPEEVDNIKDFMRDTFTTNVNAYSLNTSEKLKGDFANDFANPSNFLQEEEINIGSDYYNQQENPRGIDSASLNRRYLNNLNQRRMLENIVDENENSIGYIPRREKIDNYENIRNIDDGDETYRNSRINKTSDDKKNMKNNEMSNMIEKNIGKSQVNKAIINNNVNKNNDVVRKENHENEGEVNNHLMLSKLR
jgi:hypothetical protein